MGINVLRTRTGSPAILAAAVLALGVSTGIA